MSEEVEMGQIKIKVKDNIMSIKELTTKSTGTHTIEGGIKKIFITSGPVVVVIKDKSASIKALLFTRNKDNLRFKEGDVVKAIVEIKENKERKEKEYVIKDIRKKQSIEQIKERVINKDIKDSLKIHDKPFLIKSEIYEKLRTKMIRAAHTIKKAVMEGRPIIIKHNADADGYVGGTVIENVIKEIYSKYSRDKDAFYKHVSRIGSKAPYYKYGEALRDISIFLKNRERWGNKPPLFIIIDNGSTEEDKEGLRAIKEHGARVIVIDHHYPGEYKEGEDKKYIDIHINPYIVGGDKNITAGMLSVEIANLIMSTPKPHLYALISAISDKSEGEEKDKYYEAIKEIYDYEFVRKIARCVDYDTFYIGGGDYGILRHYTSRKNKELVEEKYKHIQEIEKKFMETANKFMHIEEKEDKVIAEINLSLITSPFSFPPPGKATGIIFEYLKEKYKNKKIAVIGEIEGEMMIIRMSDKIAGGVHEILSKLKSKYGSFNVSGGGHDVAGAIRYIKGLKEEIKKEVMNLLLA